MPFISEQKSSYIKNRAPFVLLDLLMTLNPVPFCNGQKYQQKCLILHFCFVSFYRRFYYEFTATLCPQLLHTSEKKAVYFSVAMTIFFFVHKRLMLFDYSGGISIL
ncbi:hypothetical protein DR999_PMT03535 [Platysternon megacephalum]|uniref:Uncharacterized protein n=1 Tax=Platysternon megacephalum TaxID=55544 RepID=A0A4D9F0X2_9SAUR|nr:hypothetical protein DR999_PMT03535 [Platysternon megacephalum]